MTAAVTEDSAPVLPRHVRLRHDETRGGWVLLGPERVLVLDEIALEVMKLVDGKTSVGGIVDRLAQIYDAPREAIMPDVLAMLNELGEKGFVDG